MRALLGRCWKKRKFWKYFSHNKKCKKYWTFYQTRIRCKAERTPRKWKLLLS